MINDKILIISSLWSIIYKGILNVLINMLRMESKP
jgi:hypothetical protein